MRTAINMAPEQPMKMETIISEQEVKDFLLGSGTKITDQQFKMFYGIAKAFNLNPFKRELYCIAYGQQFSIVTGYQVYIDRAMKSGMLNWWKADVLYSDEGKINWAKITIHRKDWTEPFEWTVGMREFVKLKADGKPQGQRAVMPEFMIKKVAIGQGFRLAFPNELSGMPYLPEEITDRKESYINGESVVSEWEAISTPTPPRAIDPDVISKIEAEFKELVEFDLLGIKDQDVGATKMKIVGAMKWLKDKYIITNDSPEHVAMLKIYEEALALLTNQQVDG